MKKVIKPVYYCDFCNKKGLSKHAMSVHQNNCFHNPINKRACLDCIFLDEVEIKYNYKIQTSVDDIYSTEKITKGFICRKLDKLIYHVIAEFKKLPEKYPETFENQCPMPLECEHQFTGIDYYNEFEREL